MIFVCSLVPSSGGVPTHPGTRNDAFGDGSSRKRASFQVAKPCKLSSSYFGVDVIKLSERRQSCDGNSITQLVASHPSHHMVLKGLHLLQQSWGPCDGFAGLWGGREDVCFICVLL